jgi:hypothetical protein
MCKAGGVHSISSEQLHMIYSASPVPNFASCFNHLFKLLLFKEIAEVKINWVIGMRCSRGPWGTLAHVYPNELINFEDFDF